MWSGRGSNESQPPLPSSTTQPYTPHSSFTHQMVQTRMILIHTRPCSTNSIVRMQVPSPLICLFEGYLSQRLQRVTLNGQCSPGSWYCSLSRSAKLLMFADDVLMYKPITSHSDLIAFQIDVDTIGHWSLLNHLSPNTNKTKFMLISRSKHLIYSQCPHI